MGTRERNEEFMQEHKNDYQSVVEGAKLAAIIDPEKCESAVTRLNNWDSSFSGLDIQTCSEVYDSLVKGYFGKAGKNAADLYRKKCSEHFKYASKFRDPNSITSNCNNTNPSKNDIEEQSKVISNSKDPNSCNNHVNNSTDIIKNGSKQFTTKNNEAKSVGAAVAGHSEP